MKKIIRAVFRLDKFQMRIEEVSPVDGWRCYRPNPTIFQKLQIAIARVIT